MQTRSSINLPARMRTTRARAFIIFSALLILLLVLFSRDSSRFTNRRNSPPGNHDGNRGSEAEALKSSSTEGKTLPEVGHLNFINNLAELLVAAKPAVQEINPEWMKPDYNDTVRPDFTTISPEDLAMLRKSHSYITTNIHELATHMPYLQDTRGVVMTAGGSYISMATVSIKMLRRLGSTLPIELFLDFKTDHAIKACGVISQLNVRCLFVDELLSQTPHAFARPSKYQFKAFSLLLSSFEKIIFLDADAFPIRNPDALLDVEPFKSTGLVTWPDFWVSAASHYFYDIAGINTPDMMTRLSSESGVILYNKRTHAPTLLLTVYYNYYGPLYYYPLLSQGAAGQGDKETFLHAALVLNKPFYAVQSKVGVIGNHLNGTWYTAGLLQADPTEDWSMTNAAYAKSVKRQNKVRTLFVHHNQVKLEVEHLDERLKDWRDEQGHFAPLWGTKTRMEEVLGYDAERGLWQELVSVACTNPTAHHCSRMKALATELYQGSP